MIVKYVEVGLKRSTTTPCSMLEKVLMVMLEVDIGLRSALLHPTIKVILVDLQVFFVMVITEVVVGPRPVNFFHITMVE